MQVNEIKVNEIKKVLDRQPFQPFSIRLSNGASYRFQEPRNFGAPKDCHIIMFFGDRDWVMIDPDNIVEVMN